MSDAFTGHDDNRDEAARPGDGGPFRVLVAIASFGTIDQRRVLRNGQPSLRSLGRGGSRTRVFPALANAADFFAYRHEGFWKSMDTQMDAQELTTLCAGGRGPWVRSTST
jgi:NDP-sugar pyrophosphorylase family protein